MHNIYILKNGIKLVAEKLDHIHSCCMGVWINVGSVYENDDELGISHFIEHMVFKGTKNRSAKQIAEEMDEIGAQLNAFTSKNCTCFYVKSLKEDLEKGLDVLSDLVYNPRFEKDEFEKEKAVILEEISMSADTPEDVLSDLSAKAQYNGTLSNPILGTRELISNYSTENIRNFWKKHYSSQRMVVAVVGNFDLDELIRLVERKFSNCPNESTDYTLPKSNLIFNRLSFNKKIEQSHIQLGFSGFESTNDKVYALSLASGIIGGGMSSRLFQRIREDLGLAYSVYSYTQSYSDIGSLNIYAATNPKSCITLINEINNEIDKLLSCDISDKEFLSSRSQLMAGLVMGLESASSRMNFLGKDLLLKGRTRDLEEIVSKINSISKEEVFEVIKECFSQSPSLSIVGPQAEKALKSLTV